MTLRLFVLAEQNVEQDALKYKVTTTKIKPNKNSRFYCDPMCIGVDTRIRVRLSAEYPRLRDSRREV